MNNNIRFNELLTAAENAAMRGDIAADWVCYLINSGNCTPAELSNAVAERDALRAEEAAYRAAARKIYAAPDYDIEDWCIMAGVMY